MVAILRSEPTHGDMTLPIDQVVHGECLSVMRSFPDNSVDSIITDPPAGISFMNKDFDSNRGGRDKWILWLSTIMKEALRVLRPGGHCLVWSLPRTSHWTGLALEQAGFEMRDCLYHTQAQDSAMAAFEASLTETQRDALARLVDSQEAPASVLHLFSTGFPKSLSIGKAIHKHLGIEREVVGVRTLMGNAAYEVGKTHSLYHSTEHMGEVESTKGEKAIPITASSPDLQQYEQLGSALKPACENWWLCRKPLSEKTLALNVLKWHCGGLNIDKSRVGTTDVLTGSGSALLQFGGQNTRPYQKDFVPGGVHQHPQGRFPSHVLFSHSLFCTDTVCDASCPVLALEQQSGVRKSGARIGPRTHTSDTGWGGGTIQLGGACDASEGTASRFFHCFTPDTPFLYTAKASRRERNLGCEELPEHMTLRFGEKGQGPLPQQTPHTAKPETNNHPTVKSISLMKYLCTLICPPDGLVLDMFFGSGSTGVAALQSGLHFIGIEQEIEYVTIARARIAHALQEAQG